MEKTYPIKMIISLQKMKQSSIKEPRERLTCGVDSNGDIAGITTTSGLAWKIPGRVGDSYYWRGFVFRQ